MTVILADPRGVRRLPRRPTVRTGEALDSYLEQLAAANHMTPAEMLQRIKRSTDTTRFLMLDPTAATLHSLKTLTGHSAEQIQQATLKRYDGTAIDLTGFDPHTQASYRTVAGRGWLPGTGSQICPQCLDQSGAWQIAWRLPTTTVCTRHRAYLIDACPDCGKAFRSSRHNFLRPIGQSLLCGNPGGARGRHCRLDLTSLRAMTAHDDCLVRQQRFDRALADGTAVVLGEHRQANEYHRALRSLTVLLLHIATAASTYEVLPRWAQALNQPIQRSAPDRAPRWGLAPPSDTALRSRFLTVADSILAASSLDEAVRGLAMWTEAVPKTPDGFLGWVGDHTLPDPVVSRLVMAVHAPRRRLSRALDAARPLTPRVGNIPQVIPQDLYDRHLVGLFTSRSETVRTFASLCLARTHPCVDSWAAAAVALGLPPALGVRTAQASTAAQTAGSDVVAHALVAVAAGLQDQDYRVLEKSVHALAASEGWFETWVSTHRPGTRTSSRGHAITYLWTAVAHGHVVTSPAWPQPPTAEQRARWRRFAGRLTSNQVAALNEVLGVEG